MENALFYFFSAAMLSCALLTITCRNPVSSAIFLVLVFFFMAGLFVLLHAFFLAAVQVLVYAGAIMVLFLFVIMLLNLPAEEKRHRSWFGLAASMFVMAALTMAFGFIVHHEKLNYGPSTSNLAGTTENVGHLLFSRYMLPFEVTSLLLLAAMIGVIILSKKEQK